MAVGVEENYWSHDQHSHLWTKSQKKEEIPNPRKGVLRGLILPNIAPWGLIFFTSLDGVGREGEDKVEDSIGDDFSESLSSWKWERENEFFTAAAETAPEMETELFSKTGSSFALRIAGTTTGSAGFSTKSTILAFCGTTGRAAFFNALS